MPISIASPSCTAVFTLIIVFGGGSRPPSIRSMLSIAAEAVYRDAELSGSSCMRTLDMAAGRPDRVAHRRSVVEHVGSAAGEQSEQDHWRVDGERVVIAGVDRAADEVATRCATYAAQFLIRPLARQAAAARVDRRACPSIHHHRHLRRPPHQAPAVRLNA